MCFALVLFVTWFGWNSNDMTAAAAAAAAALIWKKGMLNSEKI
jgi:hypothetical protein